MDSFNDYIYMIYIINQFPVDIDIKMEIKKYIVNHCYVITYPQRQITILKTYNNGSLHACYGTKHIYYDIDEYGTPSQYTILYTNMILYNNNGMTVTIDITNRKIFRLLEWGRRYDQLVSFICE